MKSKALTTTLDERNAMRTGRRPMVSMICPATKTAKSPKKAAIQPLRPLILVVLRSTRSLSMHFAERLQASEKRSIGIQIPTKNSNKNIKTCLQSKQNLETNDVKPKRALSQKLANLQETSFPFCNPWHFTYSAFVRNWGILRVQAGWMIRHVGQARRTNLAKQGWEPARLKRKRLLWTNGLTKSPKGTWSP